MEFSRPEYLRVGSLSLLQGISQAGIEPSSPKLQVDSLPAEPQEIHVDVWENQYNIVK